MLSGQVLNSDASLNNFIVTDSKPFIPGEEFDLVIRFINDELDLRYVPPATNIATFTFNKTDGTTFTKIASVLDSGDRSIVKMTISETESADLLGGNIIFELDINGNGSVIKKGVVKNALARFIDAGCP